jgi:hypothetical protein
MAGQGAKRKTFHCPIIRFAIAPGSRHIDRSMNGGHNAAQRGLI